MIGPLAPRFRFAPDACRIGALTLSGMVGRNSLARALRLISEESGGDASTLLDICHTGSAGVSSLPTHDNGKQFYWPTIASSQTAQTRTSIGSGEPCAMELP
jgi:hypothetical protein